MRILFYCDTVFSFGGVQRVLAEIAKALSGKHEVTILTTDTCTDLPMSVYKKKGKNWQHTILKSAGYEATHVYIKNYSLYITNAR